MRGSRSSPAPGRAFCVGADLRDGAGAAGEFAGTFWEKPTQNSFESGWEIFKPVIAAVNGYCLGYGLTLVSWCDFVIASERAEFGFPEVTIGVPTIVGAIRLPQRHQLAVRDGAAADRRTHRRARGRRRSGSPAGSCRTTNCSTRRAGSPIGSYGPHRSPRATKEVAVRAQHLPMLEAIRFGETMRKVAGATEDAAEGGRAFRERRDPEWRRR